MRWPLAADWILNHRYRRRCQTGHPQGDDRFVLVSTHDGDGAMGYDLGRDGSLTR